jgi:hypothetical protein
LGHQRGFLVNDEYNYLRTQYVEIIDHCDYLLHNSADPNVLWKAKDTKLRAVEKLANLNRRKSEAAKFHASFKTNT